MEEMKEDHVSLLVEGYPRSGFQMFSRYLSGREGVCITRLHPEYVVEKYGMVNSKFHWLSGVKQKGTICPKNVSKLVKQVRAEIKEGQERFYLDGLEYLLLWNDMGSIIRSLQEIGKMLSDSHGKLIVSIDPLTLEEKDLQRLWGAFPRFDTGVLSAGSPQSAADGPTDRDRIDGGLLVSKGLTATP
ncbi:MAG: DUF835 domain-containing protein [Methanomassiliicoccales archaeon]|nr:DUF835 domain-containing protein [Methanomassiliicoccales archaeon]